MIQRNSEFQKILYELIKYIIEQNPNAVYYIQEMIYEGKYGRRLPRENGEVPAHDGNVNDVRVSYDGSMIASASVDKTVKVWRKQKDDIFLPTSWKIIENLQIKHDSPVWAVNFSYDGELIASGDADGIIKIKSINGNSVDITIMPEADDEEQIALKLMFSPDSKLITSANWDNRVRLWQLLDDNRHEFIEIGQHDPKVYGVCFSHDGTKIASAGGNSEIKIWNVADKKFLKSLVDKSENLEDTENAVYDVKFSSNGQMIGAAYKDKRVRIWDITTEQVIKNCLHKDAVFGVSFNADANMLVSGSKDGFVRVWSTTNPDYENSQPIAEFWHGVQINSVSFSYDGKFIASGGDDKNVRIWDTIHMGESKEALIERLSTDAYDYLISMKGLAIIDILNNVLDNSPNKILGVKMKDTVSDFIDLFKNL
ncbi:MAG: WD40 repeat domain-containing protein [Aulosira sp. ZfuVER01]|nr:WD40 repeat domain-containing protein [Aulosira sp. ZfuVER01]MDZ7999030.1 WD40 repeat domain-containing protein [Aulosira sp. DedVER01a]MDZ8051246.1 WD40 repeat domain-containing protein [Aulosira sp. ZfuCHP01]